MRRGGWRVRWRVREVQGGEGRVEWTARKGRGFMESVRGKKQIMEY